MKPIEEAYGLTQNNFLDYVHYGMRMDVQPQPYLTVMCQMKTPMDQLPNGDMSPRIQGATCPACIIIHKVIHEYRRSGRVPPYNAPSLGKLLMHE